MFTKRFGNFQPFAGINQREDDRYAGGQVGFLTYSENSDGEETYQTTYVELGARCDHLADPLMGWAGVEREELLSSNACESDAERLRTADDKSTQSKSDPSEAAA